MNIEEVIKQINDLFINYNRDTDSFTVDYDEQKDGLYCHYTPYINDEGYAVSDYLLYVYETSQENLQKLKNYLDGNKIKSRNGCEWFVYWGWKE